MRPYKQQALVPPATTSYLPFRPMAGRGQTAQSTAFAPRGRGGLAGLSRGGGQQQQHVPTNTFRPQQQTQATQQQQFGQPPLQHTQQQQQAPQQQQQPQQYGNLGKRPVGGQVPVSFAPVQESEDGDFGLSDIQVREITKVVSIESKAKESASAHTEFMKY
jgi:hypothetical protein